MTAAATDTRLLTWMPTPCGQGPILRVTPLDAAGATDRRRGKLATLLASLRRLLRPRGDQRALRAADAGCAVCRDAHFEVGSAATGQEYL